MYALFLNSKRKPTFFFSVHAIFVSYGCDAFGVWGWDRENGGKFVCKSRLNDHALSVIFCRLCRNFCRACKNFRTPCDFSDNG